VPRKALNVSDAVIDALLNVELPEVDEARARLDAEADRMAQEATGNFSTNPQKPDSVPSGAPVMTQAEAAQRLGPKVLAMLAEKFNGSLTDVRHPDENDLIF
jgi:hypothetical protein